MPPNSVSKTFDFRIWSISVVLPWSTCPIIVTIGGRDTKSFGSSIISSLSKIFCASTTSSFLKSKLNSRHNSAISSSFNEELIFFITPFLKNIVRIEAALTLIFFEKSDIVKGPWKTKTPLTSLVSAVAKCFLIFPTFDCLLFCFLSIYSPHF